MEELGRSAATPSLNRLNRAPPKPMLFGQGKLQATSIHRNTDMSDDDTDVTGTANNNHQHRLYGDLCRRFSPEGAAYIAWADLRQKGVDDVEPRDLTAWDKITRLNHANKMDLATAGAVAATMVNAHTDAVMGRNQTTPALAAHPAPVTAEVEDAEWEEDEDEDEEDEADEGPVDFGYDNEEDNAEARLDYIHRINDM